LFFPLESSVRLSPSFPVPLLSNLPSPHPTPRVDGFARSTLLFFSAALYRTGCCRKRILLLDRCWRELASPLLPVQSFRRGFSDPNRFFFCPGLQSDARSPSGRSDCTCPTPPFLRSEGRTSGAHPVLLAFFSLQQTQTIREPRFFSLAFRPGHGSRTFHRFKIFPYLPPRPPVWE